MKKFFSTGVMLVMLVALFGASHYMQAQSGVPEGSEAKASQPAVVANCLSMPKVSFAATNGPETTSTTSTTFVNLAPLSVTFKVGGTALTCMKVDVAAETFAAGTGELIVMRVLLDGTTEFLPGEPQWSGDDDENGDGKWARSHAANFYLANIAPGNHTVTVQWRSFFGGTVFSHFRSLSVQHK